MSELHADVLRCQVDSLRDALVKVLEAREAEAKATMRYQNARENFSGSTRRTQGARTHHAGRE
jgi:hypothetical protein